MKRAVITALVVLVAWCGVGLNRASAQFGTLGQAPIRPRPAVSPFVNLGEGGNAFNYYGLVKPEVDAARALQQLQQNQGILNPDGSLRSPIATQQDLTTGLQTGHAATFFNYSHYYPQNPYNGTVGSPAILGGASTLGGLGGVGGLGGGLGGYGVGVGIGIGTGFGAAGTGRTFFGPNLGTGIR